MESHECHFFSNYVGVYHFALCLFALQIHEWLITKNYLLRPDYALPVASCYFCPPKKIQGKQIECFPKRLRFQQHFNSPIVFNKDQFQHF